MRIKDVLTQRLTNKKSTRVTSSTQSESSKFATALLESQCNDVLYQHEISILRQEIEAAGDRLEEQPCIDNFRRFRELLSHLAKRVTKEAYRLEKIGGTPQNPRYFEVIRIINHEAEMLYTAIIREQRNRMDITSRVIGIKGLVVDLIT